MSNSTVQAGRSPVVVVTGGAGYIGSQTCKRLSQQGYLPVVVDNLSRRHRWAVRWGPLETVDIRDTVALRLLFQSRRPRAVIHFAAFAYVSESGQSPGLYYDNNVAGTVSLLHAMRDAGISKLVLSSSCAVYGNAEVLPITETHAVRPVNPYGISKQMAEAVVREYVRTWRFRAIVLRYFNAVGADPEGLIGELHNPEPHVVPSFLEAANTGREALVFGDDWPTPDGTCVRDFVHVDDLAGAHVAALRHLEERHGCEVMNLSTGRGYSIRELIKIVSHVTGRDLRVQVVHRRPGDPANLIGDASRARKVLGWDPQFPNLTDAVQHAWHWHNGPLPTTPPAGADRIWRTPDV